MSKARAFPLSPGRHALLKTLWEDRETEDGELMCSIPGGWWLGNTRVSGNVCTWLLRHGLLRKSYTNSENGGMGTYTIYVAGEEVGMLLGDLDYVPPGAAILKLLAMRQ